MRKLILACAFVLLIGSHASAQSVADATAIKQTALDYIEGSHFSFCHFFRTHIGHSSAPTYDEIQSTRIRFS
jgi:hypothetical protein